MQRLARNKILIGILLFISIVGFLDASYLAAKHFLGDPVTCSVVAGCEVVTTSKYSVVFGIPIALVGALYYLLLSFLLILILEGEWRLLKPIFILTGTGFLVSLYLVYLQAFVLDAFCLYCLVSATTSTAVFVGVSTLLKLENKTSTPNEG